MSKAGGSTDGKLDDIIRRINIRSEYERIGTKFTADRPNASGWLACHAIGREDDKRSASVQIESGSYKDFADGGKALGFFDAMRQFAPDFNGWSVAEVVRHYAEQTGIDLSRKGSKTKAWHEKFADRGEPNEVQTMRLRKRYEHKISHAAIIDCGGTWAMYPAGSQNQQSGIALPIYGAKGTAMDPIGACLLPSAHTYEIYRGEGTPPDYVKSMVHGSAGLVGKWGVERIQSAELVWKVEGLTDLLALQTAIPEGLKDKHVVVTNSNGCQDQASINLCSGLFQGAELAIVHDCDEPGQRGAEYWVAKLGNGVANSIRNVVLPYEIEESKGKDLRDYLATHDYMDLLRIYGRTSDATFKSGDPLGKSAAEIDLERLKLFVLGTEPDDSIVCFSSDRSHTFKIKDISRWRYQNALQMLGPIVRQEVNEPKTKTPQEGRLEFNQVCNSIAEVASTKPFVDGTNTIAAGVWKSGSRVAVVGNRGFLEINSLAPREIETRTVPSFAGRIVDYSHVGDPWYTADLTAMITKAADVEYRRQAFNQLRDWIALWDNWAMTDTPEMLAGMILASWVQSVWEWRPWVQVVGPAGSGKTVFIERLLMPLFGSLVAGEKGSPMMNPTEPTIRQLVGRSSVVLVIDEFEKCAHKSNILSSLRGANRGTSQYRWSQSQRATGFVFRHIPWFGGTQIEIEDETDRTRYIINRLNRTESQSLMRHLPDLDEVEQLGQRLLACALATVEAAVTLQRRILREVSGVCHTRVRDSFSVPAAAIAACLGEPFEVARQRLEQFVAVRAEEMEDQTESRESVMLEQIFSSRVHLGHGEIRVIGHLIKHYLEGSNREALAGFGITKANGGLFISPRIASKNILAGKVSHSDIREALASISGAHTMQKRLTAGPVRGVLIPWDSIPDISRFGADASDNDEEVWDGNTDSIF
jgi:hypothetical protein